MALRDRHRPHARQLRKDGIAAVESRIARLAVDRVHPPRLEHQADATADYELGDLPHGLELLSRGGCEEGSGQRLPLEVPAASRGRRVGARYDALRQWAIEHAVRWQALL